MAVHWERARLAAMPLLAVFVQVAAPAPAHRLFESAWLEDREGQDEFLACFTEKLSKGICWRSEKLGRLLEAEEVFRVSAATPKDCVDDE